MLERGGWGLGRMAKTGPGDSFNFHEHSALLESHETEAARPTGEMCEVYLLP